MGKYAGILLLLGSIAIPSIAHADTLGSESSGTMNVSITIPPLAAALAASQAGADGLWSILGNADGVMVNAPDVLTGNATGQVTLFSTHSSSLRVRFSTKTPASSGDASVPPDNGLERRAFSISGDSMAIIPGENAAVFTIETI